MSLPVISFSCDRCGFTSSNMVFWGRFYYQIGNGRYIHVERCAGWCFDCQTFAPIEELNQEKAMNELQRVKKELWKHQEQLGKIESYKIGIISRWFTSSKKLEALRTKVGYLQINVSSALSYVNLINSRKSPARCLRCCQSNITPFVMPPVEDNPGKHLTGFIHPNCGGNIIAENSNTRIAMKYKTCIYSIEGNFLKVDDKFLKELE